MLVVMLAEWRMGPDWRESVRGPGRVWAGAGKGGGSRPEPTDPGRLADSETRRPAAETSSIFRGASRPPSRCPLGQAGRDAPRDPWPGRWPPPPLRPQDPPVTPQPWRAAHMPSRVLEHPQLWQPGPPQSQDLLQKVTPSRHHHHNQRQPWSLTLPRTPLLP